MNLAKAFFLAMSFLIYGCQVAQDYPQMDSDFAEPSTINQEAQNEAAQDKSQDQSKGNPPPQEPVGVANQPPASSDSTVGESTQVGEQSYSWYSPGRSGGGKRGLYLSPLISLLLPGFDQWWEGQYASAAFYTGARILARRATEVTKDRYLSSDDVDRINREISQGMETQSNDLRKIYLFSQYQLMTGGLSLYHAFRTAADSRPEDFGFISQKESFSDLMLAPFDLTHFTKPTTYLPLAGLAALFLAENASHGSKVNPDYRLIKLGGDDLVFSSLFSYNAGTYEEMVFRGWLQPVVYYETNNKLTSNLANSVIFALAHRNNVKIPIIQFGLGYYLGWLAMENSWSLQESIFIHSWWDLLAFLQSYHNQPKEQIKQAYWLPGLSLAW